MVGSNPVEEIRKLGKHWEATLAPLKDGFGERQHVYNFVRQTIEKLGLPASLVQEIDRIGFDSARANKASGEKSFADMYVFAHVGGEFKGEKVKDLGEALNELAVRRAAIGLPLLDWVGNGRRFEIHPRFHGTVPGPPYEYTFEDYIRDPKKVVDLLTDMFLRPEKFRPGRTRQAVAEDAVDEILSIVGGLRARQCGELRTIRFAVDLVRLMFATSTPQPLLPQDLFAVMAKKNPSPEDFQATLTGFLRAGSVGRRFGMDLVPYLGTDDAEAPLLMPSEIHSLLELAKLEWLHVDLGVFGSLLNSRRAGGSHLGAYASPREAVDLLVKGVVAPLVQEVAWLKESIDRGEKPLIEVSNLRFDISRFRVLDPTCGSGGILCSLLRRLKDLEYELIAHSAEHLGTPFEMPYTTAASFAGIDLDECAVELTRASLQLADAQWEALSGLASVPTFRPVDTVQCKDSLLEDGRPTEWPSADCVVANPLHLGGQNKHDKLGSTYLKALYCAYPEVSSNSDVSAVWAAKALEGIRAGNYQRAAFILPQSIRKGSNMDALKGVLASPDVGIYFAESGVKSEGSQSVVSVVCFDGGSGSDRVLDGESVRRINANLTFGPDVTDLPEIKGSYGKPFAVGCHGVSMGAPSDVRPEDEERLLTSRCLGGRSPRDVLKRRILGGTVSDGNPAPLSIIFGKMMLEREAKKYPEIYKYLRDLRSPDGSEQRKPGWHRTTALPKMLTELKRLRRYIGIPTAARHLVVDFLDVSPDALPEHQLVFVPREDYTTFGILQSRVHLTFAWAWVNKFGKDGERYTSRVLTRFPAPRYLNVANDRAIAAAAEELHTTRRDFLDPVKSPEVGPRTLTALYSALRDDPGSFDWLEDLHADLDAAVLDAYGLPHNISREDLFMELVKMNYAITQTMFPAGAAL